MPRLRNARTGVVVNVDDVTAATLGAGWEPADKEVKTEESKPASRRTRKKKTEDDE